MRNNKQIVTMMVIVLVLVFSSPLFGRIYPTIFPENPQPFIIKGLVTVQLEDDVNLKKRTGPFKASFDIPSLDAVLADKNISVARAIFPGETEKPAVNSGMVDLTRFYEFEFPEEQDVQEVIDALRQDPNIRMAEPVWAVPVEATPDDPEWEHQWAMKPIPPDPNFYTAWDYETGSDSIKFALIDSGILFDHRDLIGNIWVNPGEDVDGDEVVFDPDDFNGIDDDGNGWVDDLIGYDFFTGLSGPVLDSDGNTPDPDPYDFGGHGTHVAGIAAAMNNNGIDVTGVAGGWYGGHPAYRGCRIICCRVGATLAEDGLGYINSNNAATAINYAVAKGANVINASWGGSTSTAAAANNAVAAGVTFTHAAGNDDQLNGSDALDAVAGVLSVASTNSDDVKSGFSNYGNFVDVSAPGSSILSTYSFSYTPGINSISGTSMAAPMVAGLALLIRSAMPSLTKDQVDSIIVETADSVNFYALNPLLQGMLGSGRIDAYAAMLALPIAQFTSDIVQGTAPLDVQFTDLSPNSPTGWDWSFGDGGISSDQNPLYTYNDPGIYSVSLKVDEGNPLGWGEEHLKNYIWVTDDTLYFESVEDYMSSVVKIPVYLYNSAPVKSLQISLSYANSIGLKYDSVSTAGLRTEYFETVSPTVIDAFGKKLSFTLAADASVGSNYLAPGGGTVLNIYFSTRDIEGVVVFDTITAIGSGSIEFPPNVTTRWGNYWPATYSSGTLTVTGFQPAEFVPLSPQVIDENSLLSFTVTATAGFPITLTTSELPYGASFTDNNDGTGLFEWTPNYTQDGVHNITFYADDGNTEDTTEVEITVVDQPCCIGDKGNFDGDFEDIVDIADIVFMVEFQFLESGIGPPCLDEADIAPIGNIDGAVDIADLVQMVEFQFLGGTAPEPCP